jgi:hypothetical protein
MRGTMTAVLFLITCGALAMSHDVLTADDKKKEPAKREPKAPYTEFVTFRPFASGRLLNPLEDVSAYRVKDGDGKDVIRVRRGEINGPPARGAEITDKDGKVYVVTEALLFGPDYGCWADEKPKPG